MLQTIVNMEVKDSQIDEFLRVFKELADATRKETGCIQYEMYQDEGSSSNFFLLEQWASRVSFDAHIKSEHFKRIIPMISTCLVKESQMALCKKVV